MVVLLDLSAAFHTIDHGILLVRLQSYFGVDGTALAWLRSYITGRMLFVSVLGHDSEPVPMSFGVAISDLIAKHPVKHQSFADNTQLNTSFDSCVGEWGWGVDGKQVGSMDEESQVRGCYNITFICTPTNHETVSVLEKIQASKTFRT